MSDEEYCRQGEPIGPPLTQVVGKLCCSTTSTRSQHRQGPHLSLTTTRKKNDASPGRGAQNLTRRMPVLTSLAAPGHLEIRPDIASIDGVNYGGWMFGVQVAVHGTKVIHTAHFGIPTSLKNATIAPYSRRTKKFVTHCTKASGEQ